MRFGCLAVLVVLLAGVSSAASFTQTNSPAGGILQFAPGHTNSLNLMWNFYAIPEWALVSSIDNVQFGLVLAPGQQATSTFTLELMDTLTTVIGPRTAVTSGTPLGNSTYSFLATSTDPVVLNAFLADGVVNTLLARDPGPGFPGASGNTFLLLSSSITVNAQLIPEPATYLLLGAGLGALALLRRRQA